ncbi:MAG: DinB family protein [Bacteroidales bacterium]
MRSLLFVAAAFCVALIATVVAQDSSPVLSALRADESRYEKNIVAAAQAMPAAKYSTKPTDEQKAFGELLLHIAGSNTMLCSSISGQQAPARTQVTAQSGKEAIVGALKASFAYCGKVLATADDSKLAEQVPFFGGRSVSRAAAVLDLAADWGDHYSLIATEMRLAGVLPPTAQRASR